MFIGMPQRHFVQLCCSSHHIGRGSCGQRLDLDTITKALDFGGEAFDLVWLAASVEVIGAEVFVERSVCDHVVGGWAMPSMRPRPTAGKSALWGARSPSDTPTHTLSERQQCLGVQVLREKKSYSYISELLNWHDSC